MASKSKIENDIAEYGEELTRGLSHAMDMILNQESNSEELFPVIAKVDSLMEVMCGLNYLYMRELELEEGFGVEL